MRSESRIRGFTLLEILIVVAILGIIFYIINEVFFRTAISSEEIIGGNIVYQRARTALLKMTTELEQAYLSSRRKANFTIFLGINRTQEGWQRDILHFTATSHERLAADVKESDLCEISYFILEDQQTKTLTLWHREDPNPDEEKLSGGVVYELAENVLGLNFAYYDGEKWREEWDSTESGLPKAVRIALTLADESGKPHTFVSTAQIYKTAKQ